MEVLDEDENVPAIPPMSDTAQTKFPGWRKRLTMNSNSTIVDVFRSRRRDLFKRPRMEDEPRFDLTARAVGSNSNAVGSETNRNWMRQDPARVRGQTV